MYEKVLLKIWGGLEKKLFPWFDESPGVFGGGGEIAGRGEKKKKRKEKEKRKKATTITRYFIYPMIHMFPKLTSDVLDIYVCKTICNFSHIFVFILFYFFQNPPPHQIPPFPPSQSIHPGEVGGGRPFSINLLQQHTFFSFSHTFIFFSFLFDRTTKPPQRYIYIYIYVYVLVISETKRRKKKKKETRKRKNSRMQR